MKYIYYFLSALLLVNFSVQPLFSQSESENLRKYWNYRDRFHNYFVKIGSGPGNSIQVSNRMFNPQYGSLCKIN